MLAGVMSCPALRGADRQIISLSMTAPDLRVKRHISGAVSFYAWYGGGIMKWESDWKIMSRHKPGTLFIITRGDYDGDTLYKKSPRLCFMYEGCQRAIGTFMWGDMPFYYLWRFIHDYAHIKGGIVVIE